MIIEQIRNTRTKCWESRQCLDYEEAKILAKFLPKEIAKAEKKFDFYKDLQESGEATNRQQTKLVESEEYLDLLISLNDGTLEFINSEELARKGELQ